MTREMNNIWIEFLRIAFCYYIGIFFLTLPVYTIIQDKY